MNARYNGNPGKQTIEITLKLITSAPGKKPI